MGGETLRMKLLVLGRNGQVGWELERSLAPLGDVLALSRADGDLEDIEALLHLVRRERPQVLVNATGYTAVDRAEGEPDRADKVNRAAVDTLARWTATTDALFVHYSTDYVFDGRKAASYVESDDTAPQSVYGRTKRDGEAAITASGCQHLIFRTSWVHAARGSNFVRTILRLAKERSELRIVADQFGAPTSAELIADITAIAIATFTRRQAPLPSGIYHLTAGGKTNWYDFARFIVSEATERGARLQTAVDAVVPIEASQYPTAATRPANSMLDTGKLRAALGINLPDWTVHARRSVAELLEGTMA
jgi:dTDP-4-dehydrorhamnose reductase